MQNEEMLEGLLLPLLARASTIKVMHKMLSLDSEETQDNVEEYVALLQGILRETAEFAEVVSMFIFVAKEDDIEGVHKVLSKVSSSIARTVQGDNVPDEETNDLNISEDLYEEFMGKAEEVSEKLNRMGPAMPTVRRRSTEKEEKT